MTRADLSALTVDQLVDRFAEIGIAQDKALWDALGEEDYSEVSRLIFEMKDVDDELRARGRNARLALKRLYSHENTQVRLKAAKSTLAGCVARSTQGYRRHQSVKSVPASR